MAGGHSSGHSMKTVRGKLQTPVIIVINSLTWKYIETASCCGAVRAAGGSMHSFPIPPRPNVTHQATAAA